MDFYTYSATFRGSKLTLGGFITRLGTSFDLESMLELHTAKLWDLVNISYFPLRKTISGASAVVLL